MKPQLSQLMEQLIGYATDAILGVDGVEIHPMYVFNVKMVHI